MTTFPFKRQEQLHDRTGSGLSAQFSSRQSQKEHRQIGIKPNPKWDRAEHYAHIFLFLFFYVLCCVVLCSRVDEIASCPDPVSSRTASRWPQVSAGPPALPGYLEGEECRMNKGTETPVLKTHAIPARKHHRHASFTNRIPLL